MKKHKIAIVAAMLLTASLSCTKILDQAPKGALSTETLNNKEGAEALTIACYSLLNNVFSDSGIDTTHI